MAATEARDNVIEQALAYLRQRIRIEAACLFGSQQTGVTHSHRDIDLAVFSPDVDTMNFFQRIRVESDLALDCDSRLELHLYPSSALADARPTNFAGYIVTHGRRLA